MVAFAVADLVLVVLAVDHHHPRGAMSEATRKRKLIDNEEEDPAAAPAAATATPSSSVQPVNAALSEDLLRLYYERLFPYHAFVTWLAPGDPASLQRREFSFTLAGDIYVRYQSMSGKDDLRAALTQRVPHKIDIGAVFNASPALHTAVTSFLPVAKELVFDVDMTDYDDVRSCCKQGAICPKCWPFMTAAMTVVDHALRHDFGFRHLLWVYSGRRGVHCWVCDERAKALSNEARTAVVEYLSVALGGDHGTKAGDRRSNLTFPLHPMLAQSLQLLHPDETAENEYTRFSFFEHMLENQRWLEDEESRARFLAFLDDALRPELKFTDQGDGLDKWKSFVKAVNKLIHRGHTSRASIKSLASLKTLVPRIVFSHVYPRLDANVSKQLNHLLKAPFCVHPKTSRVCVPIDLGATVEFDPFAVPTLEQLERELNENVSDQPSAKPFERTSLRPYIEYFKKFVGQLQDEARKANKLGAKESDKGIEDW